MQGGLVERFCQQHLDLHLLDVGKQCVSRIIFVVDTLAEEERRCIYCKFGGRYSGSHN